MKIVVQRVGRATVKVDGRIVGSIGVGLLALVGIESGDTDRDLEWMAEKVLNLRIFHDDDGKMNRSVLEIGAGVGGGVLAVPNFTVAGDCRKGRRPSFDKAMAPPAAERAFVRFADMMRSRSGGKVRVETGLFGAHMHVELMNDGPVTLVIESPK